MQAAGVEPTAIGKAILRRLHPGATSVSGGEALASIARARDAGELARRAVEEATTDGVTSWALVGAILLASAQKEI
jgi:hypothetical protein